jgi:hypothetical protein
MPDATGRCQTSSSLHDSGFPYVAVPALPTSQLTSCRSAPCCLHRLQQPKGGFCHRFIFRILTTYHRRCSQHGVSGVNKKLKCHLALSFQIGKCPLAELHIRTRLLRPTLRQGRVHLGIGATALRLLLLRGCIVRNLK